MTARPETFGTFFIIGLLAVFVAGSIIIDAPPYLRPGGLTLFEGQRIEGRSSLFRELRRGSTASGLGRPRAREVSWDEGRQGTDARPYQVIAAAGLLVKIARKEPFVLIDCRPEKEYRAGHLPQAVNVPIDSLSFGRETVVKAAMDKIKNGIGLALSFVLIDGESGEEYVPRTKLEEFVRALPENRDDEVVLYCRRPDCTRSPLAARWAIALGYRKVTRYEGGWEDWQEKGYPVDR